MKHNFNFFRGIRGRLLLLLMLAVVPGFIVGVLNTVSIFHRDENDARSDVVAVLTHVREQFAAVIAHTMPDVTLAADDMAMGKEACPSALHTLLRNPEYTDVGIVDIEGHVVCALVRPGNTRTAVDGVLIHRAIDRKGLPIVALADASTRHLPRLVVMQPLRFNDTQQRLVYAASEFSPMPYVGVDLADIPAAIITIDASGQSNTVSNKASRAAKSPHPEAAESRARKQLGSTDGQSIQTVGRDLLGLLPLGSRGQAGVIALNIRGDDLYADAWQELLRNITLMVGGALLVLLLMKLTSERLLIKPALSLARTAERLAQGDWSARTGLRYGTDEFSSLARTFDRMAEEIAQRISENKFQWEKLNHSERLHAVLAAINAAIVRRESLLQLMQKICRIIFEVGGFIHTWIGEVDDEANVLRVMSWAGIRTGVWDNLTISLDVDTPEGRGIAATAARTGVLGFSNHFLGDPKTSPWHGLAHDIGVASALALPMEASAVGKRRVLALYAGEENYFAAEEIQLLEQLAQDAAFGLHLIETERQLTLASQFDDVTGLPNERSLLQQMQVVIDLSKATHDQTLAICVVDVDFQRIASQWGAAIGNALLQLAAPEIEQFCRDPKMAGVLHGARFALILSNIGTQEAITHHLSTLVERLSRLRVSTEHGFISLSPKLGVALIPEDDAAPESLIDKALAALDLAQSEKNVTIMFYAPEIILAQQQSLKLEQLLRGAVERNELELHYQPIVSLRTGALSGFEALLRWVHPALGAISPDRFIPLAEKTGLILAIGDWIVQQVARQAVIWDRLGAAGLFISINVSAVQLQDKNFADRVERMLAAPGMRSSVIRLALEVTESHLMMDIDRSVAQLEKFRALGMTIIIDDFGTGYSSLSYLQRLPVDVLKIDKSFVNHLDVNRQDQAMVAGILALSQSIGLDTVVEGIERTEQLELVEDMGCTYGQGFLFARALSADEVQRQWLQNAVMRGEDTRAMTTWGRRAQEKNIARVAKQEQRRALNLLMPDEAGQLAWMRRLMEATAPTEVAAVILAQAITWPDCETVSLLWGDGETQPCGAPVTSTEAAWAQDALTGDGYCLDDDGRRVAWRLLPTEQVVLLLRFSVGQRASPLRALLESNLTLASHRLVLAMELHALRDSHKKIEQAANLQRALFAISDLAGSDRDLPDLLRRIQDIVGTLMYAENFFIVRHDPQRGMLRLLHYADVLDHDGQDTACETPIENWRGTLTYVVLNTGSPLMGSAAALRAGIIDPLRKIGPESVHWLGVPMRRDGLVLGAVVVQSYREDRVYSNDDREVLEFVASHILNAMDRQQTKVDMEHIVQLRTQELTAANRHLQREILERQRATTLQTALFQLAHLATADIGESEFYERVHALVGELLNADNFYIGLVDAEAGSITFPYATDVSGEPYEDRPMGHGLSEHVVERGPLVIDRAGLLDLTRRGIIDPAATGTLPLCWLGVPLQVDDQVIGVVAVQSYEEGAAYGADDQKLLSFVALQIANSIQRRRTATSLNQAKEQLEQRVEERTQELRMQIAERERVQELLKHQVMHDPLTGLPNRSFLHDRLNRVQRMVQRDPKRRFALLYLDIDRFKLINDNFGHRAGDEFLKKIAHRMQRGVRDPDMVARLAGDEFAILLEDIESPDTALNVAKRILQALNQPLQVVGTELNPSVSIGIAVGDHRNCSSDAVLHDADIALYHAKKLGRNRYEMFVRADADN